MKLSKAIATSYDRDGILECQPDLVGSAGGVPGQAFSPYGFRGRVRDPETDASGKPGKGANVLYLVEGNELHVFQLDDCRDEVPELKKGGSVQYCAVKDAYGLFDGDNGTYTLKVPPGTTVNIQVGAGASVTVSDATVAIGDQAARALTHAQEILLILAGLVTEMTADIALLQTPPTSTTFSAYATAKAPLLTTLNALIAAQLATLPTVKAMGT